MSLHLTLQAPCSEFPESDQIVQLINVDYGISSHHHIIISLLAWELAEHNPIMQLADNVWLLLGGY